MSASLIQPPVLVPPLNAPGFLFAATSLEPNQFVALYTPTSANAFGASKQAAWTPDYTTAYPRLFFSNWMLRGAAAGTSQELDGNATILISAASVVIGGTVYIVTFSGASAISLASGAGVWCDPIPVRMEPRTKLFSCVAWQAQTTTNAMMGSFQPNATLGEAFLTASTDQSALVATGIIPNTGSTSLYAYGANAMVAQGTDGRPVVLVSGDSIPTGVGEAATFSDSRGNRGYVARGLDSTANGGLRYPFAKWTAPSARCQQCTTAADFTRRFQMIDALPNLPFTHIVQQMGINDATGSATTWQSRINTYNGLLKTKFPGAKLVQLGFTPYTTTDTSQWTTTAGQTFVVSHDWPTGFTQQVQNYYAGLPTNVDAFLFVEPYFDNSTTAGGSGAGAQGKWRTDQAFTTTLSTSTSAGAVTCTLAAAPALGAALSFNAGNAGSSASTVTGVTGGVGTGYTVTVFPGITSAQTAGITVREIAAQDGLHPSSALAASAGDLFARDKATVLR